ncbi:phosphate acetyltransferase [Patescibacteria group bacterium]|nr:phosphate acetyltransferase [Patescibacteria group bacterium]
MQNFLQGIKKKARKNPARIVFPEGFEERVIQAVAKIVKEKTAKPIVIGNLSDIKKKAKKLGIALDFIKKIEIIDIKKSPELVKKFADEFFRLRNHKGVTKAQAKKIIQDINYFGTMMVHLGLADGMISGTTYSTAETIRPALQIIKTKEKFHKVSGMFIMIHKKRLMLFADAAININPNSYDLANIAIDTAENAKKFRIKPRIAMLSFSTAGSAKHPMAAKVKEATAIIKDKRPDLIVDGEMQVDAALIPRVSLKKYPKSIVPGNANILIFPDLNSGNIAYKLVERLGEAKAIGPILQGLGKPINDLSRGCKYQDIVNLAAITTLEANEEPLR